MLKTELKKLRLDQLKKLYLKENNKLQTDLLGALKSPLQSAKTGGEELSCD
jgi:hypothetical protein